MWGYGAAGTTTVVEVGVLGEAVVVVGAVAVEAVEVVISCDL
jgi:hypothetical protein